MHACQTGQARAAPTGGGGCLVRSARAAATVAWAASGAHNPVHIPGAAVAATETNVGSTVRNKAAHPSPWSLWGTLLQHPNSLPHPPPLSGPGSNRWQGQAARLSSMDSQLVDLQGNDWPMLRGHQSAHPQLHHKALLAQQLGRRRAGATWRFKHRCSIPAKRRCSSPQPPSPTRHDGALSPTAHKRNQNDLNESFKYSSPPQPSSPTHPGWRPAQSCAAPLPPAGRPEEKWA